MVEIRAARADELEVAIHLVLSVFEEFVRPDLDEGGWEKLLEYVDVEAARSRAGEHTTALAVDGGAVVGVLEIRQFRHVSLLVVAKGWFGRGIARRLLERSVEICREANPGIEKITVHASRYALDAYRRMGFVDLAEEMVVDGIRFVPMALTLE